VRPGGISLAAVAAVAFPGDSLAHFGDHVVGQAHEVPVVNGDLHAR
jgi:hypothetical protein